MDANKGLHRALARDTAEVRFEGFGADLQQKMRAGFLALAGEAPGRFETVDGNRPAGDVAADVLTRLAARFGQAAQ